MGAYSRGAYSRGANSRIYGNSNELFKKEMYSAEKLCSAPLNGVLFPISLGKTQIF